MVAEPTTLRGLFRDAEDRRRGLDEFSSTVSDAYQENLAAAITSYEECLKVANEIALFSPNETLEDINSSDLEYLLINFRLAQLIEKLTRGERKQNLLAARSRYERFLKLLDSYDILSKADTKLMEQYFEDPDKFSTASTTDPIARRNAKIARFKEQKELKNKLDYLRKNPTALESDEDALRDLHLTNISLCVHETFQALESMALELQMLAMAPPAPPSDPSLHSSDERQRNSSEIYKDGYSERLDDPSLLKRGWSGPLLSKDGKPLRPFTLTDKRTELRKGVFRPDHSLPTMSIDEYLEEERKRGGIIEGGGEKSGIRPEPEDDDMDKVDAEIMKQRAWDDWKDENPRGAGNTMNRG
ncbi:uncharacterized protein PV09_09073 [Verruconis gallopava]|uniref:TAP42-like protein n=1 Tax=Verruconis gallopava TaxID=253628 RepID=A0A0D1ZYP4_9PEZI|nr:uncharacterized protein PV09_09073 [Verruconis gallopava]KIV99209.1 hypothetical protein PV09_09073 [Verruconis gallopava]